MQNQPIDWLVNLNKTQLTTKLNEDKLNLIFSWLIVHLLKLSFCSKQTSVEDVILDKDVKVILYHESNNLTFTSVWPRSGKISSM